MKIQTFPSIPFQPKFKIQNKNKEKGVTKIGNNVGTKIETV
jgi:hypothetical protein